MQQKLAHIRDSGLCQQLMRPLIYIYSFLYNKLITTLSNTKHWIDILSFKKYVRECGCTHWTPVILWTVSHCWANIPLDLPQHKWCIASEIRELCKLLSTASYLTVIIMYTSWYYSSVFYKNITMLSHLKLIDKLVYLINVYKETENIFMLVGKLGGILESKNNA